MSKQRNRLASLFESFGNKYELPLNVDQDDLGGELGIHDGNQTIFTSYSFDPSEDSYEFGAALGQIKDEDLRPVSWEVMHSAPIRGITERIDDQGRYLITGSRDGLRELSDADIQRRYLDDVSRIAESNDQFKDIIDRVHNQKPPY